MKNYLNLFNKKIKRTRKQLKRHYRIEKELADRLRHSDRNQRKELYKTLYDELFERVPDHPCWFHVTDPEYQKKLTTRKAKLVEPFISNKTNFLEIGAGNCSLSLFIAEKAKKVYALDVSKEMIKDINFPRNCEFVLSDGVNIPVPEESIDVAYSYQVIEHLHPEDVFIQLKNIYSALAPHGVYICVTPNRLLGPHDISKYFSNTAEGFHLKEYTATELKGLFKKAGFSKIFGYIGGRGFYLRFPLVIIELIESILRMMPCWFRNKISSFLLVKAFLGAIIAGRKN
ncbi:MAG: class I SAM-dependent methyltransferase [Elusimicrobiota bacterium]